jgi:hypothetical protein
MATISGIQWWTLGVAGAAVVASVVGILLNHHFSQRSEHDVWLRDLRVRLYAEFAETVQELFSRNSRT